MTINVRTIAMAAMLAGAAACGDGTAPAVRPVGEWTLARVNGSPTPALLLLNSAGTVTAERGTLSVRADGSFTETQDRKAVFFTGAQFVTTVRENGTWTATDAAVTFVIPGAPGVSYTGSFDARALRFTFDGTTYEFTR